MRNVQVIVATAIGVAWMTAAAAAQAQSTAKAPAKAMNSSKTQSDWCWNSARHLLLCCNVGCASDTVAPLTSSRPQSYDSQPRVPINSTRSPGAQRAAPLR